MKILHTADWHIGNFPGPEIEGKNLRAKDTQRCINHLFSEAIQQQPDIVIIAGDLFHQARVWADRGLSETNIAIQAIEGLSRICAVVVMRGTPNHDGAEQFEMLRAHFKDNNDVYIITTPTVLEVAGASIAALPGFDRGEYRAKFPGLSREEENLVFTEELGKIVLGLRAQCDKKRPAVLVSHYTVPGCNTESGQTQFLAQFEPVIMPDILDAAEYDLVALGHIHKPQQVTSCRNTYYAGAINAMNFNDEGQERGFWIHEFAAKADELLLDAGPVSNIEFDSPEPWFYPVSSEFYSTPIRQFTTFRFTDTDVVGINTGEIDAVAHNWWNWSNGSDVKDKIVRILYSCTEEANKAFNKALLEKRLYDDGAFWVSEISPEKISISTSKNELSERTDPEHNLVEYLREKAYPDDKIGSIVEAARPIIAEVMAGASSARAAGLFMPLQIEVKNYRNYAAANFDFADVSFCVINGKNGAGKSSLFMDALLDCLYEEPREGDLAGWIRADEDARSGSISFSFMVGDKTYRVVRTRAKSGKATLNLAELVDGKWVDRSAEKMRDTQNLVIETVGMDSLTLKACALIMQDQYGLFLQASKEDRMAILGNILGLGIYNDMEQLARIKATDINREINQKKILAENLSKEIASKEELEDLFCGASLDADNQQATIRALAAERDNINLQLSTRREAAARAAKLFANIQALEDKKRGLDGQRMAQVSIIKESDTFLSSEPNILAGVAKHNQLLSDDNDLATRESALAAQINAMGDIKQQRDSYRLKMTAAVSDENRTKSQAQALRNRITNASQLAEAAEKLAIEKQRLDELDNIARNYVELSNKIMVKQQAHSTHREAYSTEAASRTVRINMLTQKADMLKDSNCLDVVNAKCFFLADAKQAAQELEEYVPVCTAWKQDQLAILQDAENEIIGLTLQRDALDYNSIRIETQRQNVKLLEPLAREYEQLPAIREQIALLEEQAEAFAKQTQEYANNLEQVRQLAETADRLAAELAEIGILRTQKASELSLAKTWLEREKLLPVARERKATAQSRIEELARDMVSVEAEIQQMQSDRQAELLASAGAEGYEAKLLALTADIEARQQALQDLQRQIGAWQQSLDQIAKKEDELQAIQAETAALSDRAAWFEILKTAFSQDGIPHNIIRSMLPMITATANSILGQMTGGKMGVDFITDKVLKSNNKKEVPTLDIVIEEYGKGSLPYLSKSGGEKVKASLAVILALAETKSSQAGIQLGMLFIDEPPFLDSDGMQAYCDSLETVQGRYPNLKVMAITHDPAMKARFPQSLDVVKTENGSVIVAA